MHQLLCQDFAWQAHGATVFFTPQGDLDLHHIRKPFSIEQTCAQFHYSTSKKVTLLGAPRFLSGYSWQCQVAQAQLRQMQRQQALRQHEEAAARRDQTLAVVASMNFPNNPLDTLIDELGGPGKVAEMTGGHLLPAPVVADLLPCTPLLHWLLNGSFYCPGFDTLSRLHDQWQFLTEPVCRPSSIQSRARPSLVLGRRGRKSIACATCMVSVPVYALRSLAVVTGAGRKGRLVRRTDGPGVRFENRNVTGCAEGATLDMINVHERTAFLDGTKDIAVISEAASAGISLHADRCCLFERSSSPPFLRYFAPSFPICTSVRRCKSSFGV